MADDRFHIQSDSPAAPKMLFWRVAGHESLSRPSAYELWVLSESADIAARDVLGRAFDIVIDFYDADGGQHQRHCQGYAVRLIRGGAVGRYHQYRITLRSWFWLLTKRSNSRVLQDQSALQILDAVCSDSPITRIKKTDITNVIETHPLRRYCVQFNESDYTYLSRLLENEGIYYWFDAHDNPGTMTLSDASGVAHQKLPAAATLNYNPGDSEARHAEIMRWSDTDFFETGKYAARDRNFKTVRQTIGADINVAGTYELADLEAFEYPGGYFDNARAQEVTKVRGEELAARRQRYWALSQWPDIAAGRTFTLKGSTGDDGDYLIGASTFFISHPGYESQAQPEDYGQLLPPVWAELLEDDPVDPGAAQAIAAWIGDSPLAGSLRGASVFAFTALPAAVNYRPPRTIPPRTMPSPQSAFVVGPEGEELHVDSFGRVKVQFHWDRYGKNDEKSSCWVRVSQPWAGKGWGGYFAPRIGQEVLVDFINGDPDRPVIAGRVYNDDQPIPYQSPTQSGFKTRSTPGGSPSNYSEIMFEDKKDQENLNIHAERNMSRSVEADDSISVGHDQSETIDHDQTVTVKNDQTLTVKNDRKVFVKGEETREITHDQHNTIHQHQHNTVDWQQYNSIGQHQHNIIGDEGQFNQIAGKVETIIGQNEIHTVKAGQNTTITGGLTNTVTSGGATHTITGGLTNNITGKLETKVTDALETSAKSIKHSSETTVDILATQKGTFKSNVELLLAAGGDGGASIDMKPGEITISAGGSQIKLDASGVSINGAKVSLNG